MPLHSGYFWRSSEYLCFFGLARWFATACVAGVVGAGTAAFPMEISERRSSGLAKMSAVTCTTQMAATGVAAGAGETSAAAMAAVAAGRTAKAPSPM
jgi:hypothetical protein